MFKGLVDMEKNKILQIVPFSSKGGVESIANNLFLNMTAPFTIIYGFTQKSESESESSQKVYFKNFLSLFMFLRKNHIKLIHSHMFSLRWMVFIRFCSIIFKTKVVTTLHSDFGIDANNPNLLKKGRRLFIIKILHSIFSGFLSDKWIAISSSVQSLLLDVIKIKESKVVKIFNPIAATTIDINESERRENIVFVGRDSQEKNIQDVLYVWDNIKNLYDYTSLVLIGVDSDSESLRVYSSLEKERIMALGWLSNEEKKTFLNASILQIVPSFYEGFCLAAAEALEMNIPVVSYKLPVLSEFGILFGGVNAVPCYDRNKLLEAVKGEINKVNEGYQIDTKNLVHDFFSQKKFIEQHRNLYKETMEK